MAYQNITGVQIGQLAMTTTYVTIYTVPVNTRTYVKDITIVNTTASPIQIYVSLVPSGNPPAGTAVAPAGTGNAIFYGNALPGYTTVQWTGSQILNANDTIQVKASATGCTVSVTGGEAL
jgi:hypothetical protein